MRRVWQFPCLAVLWASTAHAQHYPFIPMTPRLPASCLIPFQDSHGRLWLAGCETGIEGIFYFDGTQFVSPLKNGFPNAIVRGMAEDSDGGIWFSSTAGIFRLYKGKLENIVSGVAEAGIEKIAPDVFLAAIGKSANEATATADAVRIGKTAAGWKAEPVVTSISQVQFRLDASGHILFGCNGGYCELQRDEVLAWRGGSPVSVIRHSISGSNDYANSAALVLRDHSGCVWLKSNRQASYQCATDTKPVPVPASPGYPWMLELPDGAIVIRGITRLTIGRPGHFQVLTAQNGYPGAAFPVADKSGNLWVICRKGLFYLPWRMGMEFWSESEGLKGDTVSLLQLNGKLFTIAGEVLEVLEADRQHWRVLASLGDIQHLAEGPDGTILASSPTRGVLQINQDGKILRRSIAENISLIRRGKEGKLWAVGGNVWSVSFTGQDVHLQPQFNEAKAVGHDLKIDAQGSPWACYGDGLRYRHGSEWMSMARAQGLTAEGCASLAVEPDGDVWYADYILRALYQIHEPKSAKPEIREFQSGGEIGTASATFFETDHRGWLWRGSSDGIYVADFGQAKLGEWLHLDLGDGLPTRLASAHSFFEDSDGSVWYCADTSVIHVSPPGDLVHPRFAPSVFVSTFSTNGGAARMADTVEAIGYGSDISAHIGSLQFDRRSSMRLRYRVLPDQADWTDTRDFDLRFAKLRWGHHTLQVQAQLATGPWSPISEQSLDILRPFWLTWPAFLIAGAGGTGLGLGAFQWRKRQRFERDLTLPNLTSWRMTALSPETAELIGTVVDGRYEIGHILSIGGFATVVRARDLHLDGTPCAVKLFRYEVGKQAWIRHRFEQEVTALEQLVHPNIVRITGHGVIDGGAPYLVMEFIHGQTLDKLLEVSALRPSLIARFLRQLGSALATLHEAQIFHRDIKPENLMIRTNEENQQEIVLVDFSIAIVKSPEHTFHGISRVAGTLEYMAPEQVIGYADATTDIYSLAKVVMEMLTGSNWANLLPKATLDLPEQVRSYLVKYHGLLSIASVEMIASALMFDPERRPKHVSLFVEPIIRDLDQAP